MNYLEYVDRKLIQTLRSDDDRRQRVIMCGYMLYRALRSELAELAAATGHSYVATRGRDPAVMLGGSPISMETHLPPWGLQIAIIESDETNITGNVTP